MGAVLLDGKGLSREIEDDLKNRVEKLNNEGIEPHLAVILVGDDPASHVYVRNKENACKRTGIKSTKIILPASTSEKEVLDLIEEMNEDDDIHGILVQSPTPKQINELEITNKINPAKDVDGFHPQNLGKLVQGDTDGLLPCTPAGIMKLLIHAKIKLEGKKVTVIGRSRIVGMPLSLMLAQKGVDATVTITHSRSKNIEQICQSSDVIIAAVGRPEFVKKEWIR
ncbi:MAG: bifunctional 5,10-methylenetetrahydrofolate dehydrogenase/5,10-methenyltetrahydrofolate cyclohydrolase, partial [Candidatus Thalassarchaeaceae archaeon]